MSAGEQTGDQREQSAGGQAEAPEGVEGPPFDLSGLESLITGPARVLRYAHEAERIDQPEGEGAAEEAAAATIPTDGAPPPMPERWTVDVVVVDGSPAPGYSTYATSGLRRWPTNVRGAEGREVRTELVMVARAPYRAAADVLDSCVTAIAAGSVHVMPGAILPDAVGRADPGRRCPHVLLVPPFLWPELQVVDDTGDDAVITRLQAVPIAREELEIVSTRGAETLFRALESAGADVTDPDRDPVRT